MKKVLVFVVFTVLLTPLAYSISSDEVFGKFKEQVGDRYEAVQERKEELQETKEANRLRVCENLEEKIDTKVNRFNNNIGIHVEKYNHLKDRLEKIVGKLENKGFDIDKLEEDLLILDDLIKEYAVLYKDFVENLKFTRGYACGKSEGDFKDSLAESKDKRDLVKAKREEIREFYKNVIREDIKDLRQQASELKSVEESTSSEGKFLKYGKTKRIFDYYNAFADSLVGRLAFYFLVVNKQSELDEMSSDLSGKEVFVKKTQEEEPEETEKIFDSIVEDENTPDEINNQVLDELDQIIISIDEDEDLSDLEEY